jgi:hypothetical protein
MKYLLLGIVIVFGSTTIVIGQQARTVHPAVEAETRAKVVAELASASMVQIKKDLPFSAEEVSESVQTLVDGNRIVRSSTGKIYRNSEGRVRREHSGGSSGMMSSFYTTAPGVMIMSPSEGHNYILDTQEKTVKLLEAQKELTFARAPRAEGEDPRLKGAIELRRQVESEARVREPLVIAGSGSGGGYVTSVTAPVQGFSYVTGVANKFETRVEDLGSRDFEGVSAEGTRRITTIPAGAVGNELPIETSYERWYSKELGMVVYSKNTDPRFGEQTYRLTNIVRAEPDPSLFSVPTEYRRIAEPAQVYKINSVNAKPPKGVSTPKTVTVVHPAAKVRP